MGDVPPQVLSVLRHLPPQCLMGRQCCGVFRHAFNLNREKREERREKREERREKREERRAGKIRDDTMRGRHCTWGKNARSISVIVERKGV
jgi:hypothetical protein